MSTLHSYLPQDRRRALSRGQGLPDRASGSALFADISGFTPLTEAFTLGLGARRGIEELTHQINAVYDALIMEIEKYGGSVVGFAGDAITCWFDGERASQAVTAALALQTAMTAFPKLGLKVAVASGPARRFEVGDPAIQLLDVLAGVTVARLAIAEHLATRGEVLIDIATAEVLAETVVVNAWRTADDGERFAVVKQLAASSSPVPAEAVVSLEAERVRPWVLPAIFEREQSGHGAFLTELRPAVALFLRFAGIEFDHDEQAGDKLTALIGRIQAILTRNEGALLQLIIGDKGSYLCAAFGAPIAHEDDARRSVRAALEIQQISLELPFLHPVNIGISQGIMRTGAYGGTTRGIYGVHGDEVNVAARLMTTAGPGEILVSGRVQKAVADLFSFEPRPPLLLKGKAEPMLVFAVTGKRHQRAIRLEEPHYASPMIGRSAELALIGEKLELALRGHGQVIGISADAGMGKSRLVAEVIRLAHKLGFTGFGGACESSGTNTPYLVWKAIWQAFFDVDPTAPSRRQIRNLEGEIEDRAPLRVDAIPVLSPLLDIPIENNDFTRMLEPKDRRNVLTATLEECLKSAAAETPLLMVLEDLHWIDALSHDLLETLTRVSASLPICFVLAYRPPETVRLQAPRVESLPYFTHVTLEQLTATEAEQLIRAKLAQLFPARTGALPQALVSQLTARAEGNPFYIEELLNYLRDRDISLDDDDVVHSLELPVSLHALILSRIDRLSEAQKAALKAASIIGRLFSLIWLHGYYPALGSIDTIKAELIELAQLDLTPLDMPEPELTYLFKHIVTREVAYESLTYATRAQLHEQLARFIETQDADRYLDLLAFHYDLSNNTAKQRRYLQQAGEAALATFANPTAIDYFVRLLPLLDDPDAQLELHLKLGTVLQLMGQLPEAEAEYRAALVTSEQVQDRAATARCRRALGTLSSLRGDFSSALVWLEQARDTFATLDDQAELALTLIKLGGVWELKGEYVKSRQELETGLALALALADKPAAALALNRLGVVAQGRGDVKGAWSLLQESLALHREMGNKMGIAMSLNSLGVVANDQGDYQTARALYEESLALKREMGDKRGISIALGNLGVLAQYQGDFTAARTLYETSLMLNREMGDKQGIAILLLNLGELAIEQGDPMTAQALYVESLSLCHEIGDKINMVCNLSGMAAVVADMSDLSRATRLAAAAETLRLSVGVAREPVEGRIYEHAVASARAGLSEVAFRAAWAEGEQMSLNEAVNYALTA